MPVILVGVTAMAGCASTMSKAADWRTASRASSGIAPNPQTTNEAVVQVYGARAWSWRGWFGIHTWIAVKPEGAVEFTVYEVIGWRKYGGYSVVSVSNRPADGRWFGAMPELLYDARGDAAAAMISDIDKAAKSYPYPNEYTVWPGPNSNTFVAHVARHVDGLKLDLPPTAIGKDYLGGTTFFDRTPSGTGFQVSLLGAFGVMLAVEEGIEVNVLGLTFGVDPMDLAVKLPGVGRIGPKP